MLQIQNSYLSTETTITQLIKQFVPYCKHYPPNSYAASLVISKLSLSAVEIHPELSQAVIWRLQTFVQQWTPWFKHLLFIMKRIGRGLKRDKSPLLEDTLIDQDE